MTNTDNHPAPRRARKGFTLVKGVVIAAALAAVGGGAYIAIGRGSEGASHSAAEVATAQKLSFDIILTASGELAAKKQTELRNSLEMESTIGQIVEEGKFVKKDEVLVKLNDEEIQKQKDAEQLEYTGAQSEAISAQKGYEIQEIENDATFNKAKVTLELAELEFKKWQGENAAKLEELGLNLSAAKKDHERMAEKYEKAKTLHERQFLSTDQLKQDEVTLIEASSKLQVATTNLSVHKEYTQVKEQRKLESDIAEAVAEVERIKRKNESEISSKKAALDRALAEKGQRERQLDKLNRQLADSVIKAPSDGLVVYASSVKPEWQWNNQGPMAIGRKVYPNETIIILPDTTEMLAQIKVHESLVSRIKPGQKAVIKIDAVQGKSFEGVVDTIGIMAQSGGWSDPNLREYEVKIALKLGPDSAILKPSMRCEAQVTTERVENVLAVPLPAVFNDGGGTVVYRIVGSKYEKVPVKVGRRSDLLAEITSGLQPDEAVLLREPPTSLVINAGETTPPTAPTIPGSPPASTPTPTTPAPAPAPAPAASTEPESDEPDAAPEPAAEDNDEKSTSTEADAPAPPPTSTTADETR